MLLPSDARLVGVAIMAATVVSRAMRRRVLVAKDPAAVGNSGVAMMVKYGDMEIRKGFTLERDYIFL